MHASGKVCDFKFFCQNDGWIPGLCQPQSARVIAYNKSKLPATCFASLRLEAVGPNAFMCKTPSGGIPLQNQNKLSNPDKTEDSRLRRLGSVSLSASPAAATVSFKFQLFGIRLLGRELLSLSPSRQVCAMASLVAAASAELFGLGAKRRHASCP